MFSVHTTPAKFENGLSCNKARTLYNVQGKLVKLSYVHLNASVFENVCFTLLREAGIFVSLSEAILKKFRFQEKIYPT